MADLQNVRALCADLESDRVERKRTAANSMDRIAEAICAFSNDMPNHHAPGYVFVGLEDDGSCANLRITDDLLLNLSHIRSNGNILPLPVMSVERIQINGCEFVAIEVQPHPSPPVRFDGRTWIRVGPRRATATRDEERVLTERRRASTLSYDQSGFTGAEISDLNVERFREEYLPSAIARETLRENGRSESEQLRALRLLTPAGQPNLAAVLAFCDYPRQFVPGAYIQFVRYTGTDVFSDISDEKEIDGPLVQMLLNIDDLVKISNPVSVDFTSASREISRTAYSYIALQQIIRNAVMHRNYETSNSPIRVYWFSDRVEIHNPGDLFGQVNRENFGLAGITDYRNPVLAEVMKSLGFVQRFGIGVSTAKKESLKNGNPEPEFDFSTAAVAAILRLN